MLKMIKQLIALALVAMLLVSCGTGSQSVLSYEDYKVDTNPTKSMLYWLANGRNYIVLNEQWDIIADTIADGCDYLTYHDNPQRVFGLAVTFLEYDGRDSLVKLFDIEGNEITGFDRIENYSIVNDCIVVGIVDRSGNASSLHYSYGLYNLTTGKYIIKPEYDSLGVVDSNTLYAHKNQLSYLLDFEGEIIATLGNIDGNIHGYFFFGQYLLIQNEINERYYDSTVIDRTGEIQKMDEYAYSMFFAFNRFYVLCYDKNGSYYTKIYDEKLEFIEQIDQQIRFTSASSSAVVVTSTYHDSDGTYDWDKSGDSLILPSGEFVLFSGSEATFSGNPIYVKLERARNNGSSGIVMINNDDTGTSWENLDIVNETTDITFDSWFFCCENSTAIGFKDRSGAWVFKTTKFHGLDD